MRYTDKHPRDKGNINKTLVQRIVPYGGKGAWTHPPNNGEQNSQTDDLGGRDRVSSRTTITGHTK